jgi:hypothetical protein
MNADSPTDNSSAASVPTTADERRWAAEVQRLEAILEGHAQEKRFLLWFLKLGAVGLVPSFWLHPLYGPGVVLLLSLSGFLCGHYFVRGHIQERLVHLALAQHQLEVAKDPSKAPATREPFGRRVKLASL